MIEIKQLTKRYKDKKALDGLSLNIKKGVVFGLLGVNGAGKTTLLSVLNGLVKPDGGSVNICGFDISKDIKDIKKISSIIPQNFAFYENLSVEENLDFFAKIQNAKAQDIQNAIEINSLEDLLKQKASSLSGGQKRRLNISIGLLNNPQIIYFDEPTVGIDPKSRNEILDSIKGYKDFGITVVYTSHYMNEIEKICDEVAIIDKGQLIEHSSVEDLISNRNTDTITIQTVYSSKAHDLGLNFIDDTTIQSVESNLCDILQICKENNILIKNINYGSSNLEKHFLQKTDI